MDAHFPRVCGLTDKIEADVMQMSRLKLDW